MAPSKPCPRAEAAGLGSISLAACSSSTLRRSDHPRLTVALTRMHIREPGCTWAVNKKILLEKRGAPITGRPT